MKKVLISILTMVSISCYSQNDNIYVETLERFINLLETEYKWTSDKIFFNEVFGITDYFPNQIKGFYIVVLCPEEIEDMIEGSRSIYIYRISPLIFKDGVFSIEISGASYNKEGTIIVDSGYRYNYAYDCGEKKFCFLQLEGGGI